METGRITALADVPEDSTFLFRVADEAGEEREAILVADVATDADGGESSPETGTDDGVACWLNYCQHLTHIKLDKGSGAPMRDGELVCANHGAYFEADSGRCTFGPCEGAYLSDLEVTVSDGDVYLTDEDYEFVGTGPLEGDDLDRTSTSNVEF
ncbi:Rieske (2Fe-2S) protein [Natrinema versiforme]|uniref:Rieske iron-sulfur domain protein n=1 Tax=Natrinema versiforme JCM 10478 TaxID=1227496 RepID=L9YC20_9EURY|nr:Rieske 2Fe-2S domain-containing protein [Natrinema versiforme]ELY71176.1 Rieske iron-sulfur domain protein [Natrinema versiforme JCM 10478]